MDKKNAIYATGRRKTAVARVWLCKAKEAATFKVNEQDLELFARRANLRMDICRPLEVGGGTNLYSVWATVAGGGEAGQAGAIRHGLARALVEMEPNLRSALRKEGLITRDPRKKERKKYGQKGARKRFQYVKR